MKNLRLIKNGLGEYGILADNPLGGEDILLWFPRDPNMPNTTRTQWGTRVQAEYGIEKYKQAAKEDALRNQYEVVNDR